MTEFVVHKVTVERLMPVILATWEADCSLRPAQTNNSRDPMSKIAKQKWTRDVAQVVEHMLCKFKTLSSIAVSLMKLSRGPGGEVHAQNPNHLGGRDQEDHGSRPR
jgi:hypothetical protein